MKEMIEQIKGLPISDATARLIACQRTTDIVYSNILQSLQELYGDYAGEEIMKRKCLALFNDVIGVIQEFVAKSISSNAEDEKMKSI